MLIDFKSLLSIILTGFIMSYPRLSLADPIPDQSSLHHLFAIVKVVQTGEDEFTYAGAGYSPFVWRYFQLDAVALVLTNTAQKSRDRRYARVSSYLAASAAVKYSIGQATLHVGRQYGSGPGTTHTIDGDVIGVCECVLTIQEPFLQLDYRITRSISVAMQKGRFYILNQSMPSNQDSLSVLVQYHW